jgi:GAF domain-containing protein
LSTPTSAGLSSDQQPPPEAVAGLLSEVLVSTTHVHEVLDEVVRLAADVIAPDLWCGITLEAQSGPVTVALSHPAAARLDDVQYDVDDGPCLHALRSGEVVLLQDTGRDRRWQAYCATAAGLGVCSSLSVPLGAQGHAPGALNLYAGRPAVFGDREIGRATAFGTAASRALGLAVRLTSAGELTQQLQQALVSRTTIDQAIGVVMGQNRCDAETAFTTLRSASQNRNVKLRDVAAGVLRSVSSVPPVPPAPSA